MCAALISLYQSFAVGLCPTINTCHFGKNTLFYNGGQHLPIRVLQFLVAMAVTESLNRREPREALEVSGCVLQTHQHLD